MFLAYLLLHCIVICMHMSAQPIVYDLFWQSWYLMTSSTNSKYRYKVKSSISWLTYMFGTDVYLFLLSCRMVQLERQHHKILAPLTATVRPQAEIGTTRH